VNSPEKLLQLCGIQEKSLLLPSTRSQQKDKHFPLFDQKIALVRLRTPHNLTSVNGFPSLLYRMTIAATATFFLYLRWK